MHILFECGKSLPVKKYGGTERIIYWQMKALVQLGHQVSFIGPKESQVSQIGVQLISFDRNQDWRTLIPKQVDLIHLFATPNQELPKPFLVTIEGNGQLDESFHLNTTFISKKHAENHGSDVFVYNGIDLDEYPFDPSISLNWNHFLFLAKGAWKVKNLKDCIRACQKQKKFLDICGGRYFGWSSWIRSHGMVDQNQKISILQKSDALLFPVRWHEPFGIAITECLAMGRPVIGSSYGSLPELISEEVGVICKSYEDFETAIASKTKKFKPIDIRHYVEKYFSSLVMAHSYLKLYTRILDGESLHQEKPKAQFQTSPEELLPF